MSAPACELRAIPDYPGYYAAKNGDIWSNKQYKWHKLKPILNHANNQVYVTMYSPDITYRRKSNNGKTYNSMRPTPIQVHRLMTMSGWIPPKPEGSGHYYGVDHINESRFSNGVDNIEWVTHAENIRRYRENHPEFLRGENNSMARLTEAKVLSIRARRGIASYRELAKENGVAHSTIVAIMTRRSWAHI